MHEGLRWVCQQKQVVWLLKRLINSENVSYDVSVLMSSPTLPPRLSICAKQITHRGLILNRCTAGDVTRFVPRVEATLHRGRSAEPHNSERPLF